MSNLDVTLEALAHLICSDREDRHKDISRSHHKHHKLTPEHFDGFEIFNFDSGVDDDDFILVGDHANDQPIWPIDISTASPNIGDDWEPGTWQFLRMRTLNPKLWRNKLSIVTPRMAEISLLISRPSGNNTTVIMPFAIVARRARNALSTIGSASFDSPPLRQTWNDPSSYGTRRGDDDPWATKMMQFAGGFALRRHYLWSVLLGEGGGPRARFATDPTGVREAFRLRDVPPGKQRRAALLHWVRAHWRKKRVDPADKAWIGAHLRGAWSYTWNGLHCQIEPSVEDMEMLSGGGMKTK